MSRRRSGRYFDESDTAALLTAIGSCREACIVAMTKAPIGGTAYQATHKLVDAIDATAAALTGNREYFRLPLHKAGPDLL